MEHRERGIGQALLGLGRDLGRGDLAGGAGLVLVAVVIKALGRDDLDAGQGLVAEDADLHLAAADVLLDEDAAAFVGGCFQRSAQFGLVIGDGHADARAGVVGLDDAGQLRLRADGVDVHAVALDEHPRRGLDAKRCDDALGQVLIHGDGAAEVAAAGIGDAEQVERRLHAAVLSGAAVQGQKHDIRHGAHLEHVLAEQARALELALRAHGLQIRRALINARAAERRRIVKHMGDVAGIVLKTEKHIQQHDLVAALLERAGNFRAARDRDVALGAQAAAKNCNFHWEYPLRFLIVPPTDGIV